MADVPLTHLSRPQLVHLLLRIVDLLSQPVTPVQPAPPVPSGPRVELYDARLDPWNAPDEGQVAPSGPRDHGGPVGAGGPYLIQGHVCLLSCHVGTTCLQSPIGLLGAPPLACHALVWMDLGHCLVLLVVVVVGCPKRACPLRMLYLGVARGCMSVAVHVGCVVLPVYCSVLDTRTTCVSFTKYRDATLGTYDLWWVASALPFLQSNWSC